MAFPIGPDSRSNEPESLFMVQDPFVLRRSVTPVFIRDLHDGMFYGCGTSFFVTPFWRQLSAMHVVTDFFEERGIPVRQSKESVHEPSDAWIQILFDPGLGYGVRPAGSTLPVTRMLMFPRDQSVHPLAATFTAKQLNRLEPSLDLISWQVAGAPEKKTEFLPIRIGMGPFVAPGDRVLALGYRINESMQAQGRAMVTYREEMVGSIATVIEVHPQWDQDKCCWPRLVVDTYWPGGMSGGPVFSEAGEVVGIVSRGGPTWSQALWLQRLPLSPEVFPGLDGRYPGWVKGWGVCNNPQSLIDLFPTRELAEKCAEKLGAGVEVRAVCTPLGCQGLKRSGREWVQGASSPH